MDRPRGEVRLSVRVESHEVTMDDGRTAVLVEAYGLCGALDEVYVVDPWCPGGEGDV